MKAGTDHAELAKLLFPDITKIPEDYELRYPERAIPAGACVTRLGPSPTGFIHLGNLYMAFANERMAHQSGGVFFLRIEDTDRKREMEGAAETLVDSLAYYEIHFDEGVAIGGETGNYGPYFQSRRKDIYLCIAKKLVEEGKAYPCFLSEEEISHIRLTQEERKLTPGIYGEWAKHRDLSLGEVRDRITKNEPYVVRFRADSTSEHYISVEDGIRGLLSMPENKSDIVLLKADGMPTYHFAHAADDHLMRVTHVVRGEEWLSSLPIHIALFSAMGWEAPVYCHTSLLMKMEGETKRKLSKRKDPELSLGYYRSEGYHPLAIREYLLTIINSNFEEWRLENPLRPITDFTFTIEKMSRSGILFDLDKLRDVSKEALSKIPASELSRFIIAWAKAERPEIAAVLEYDIDYLTMILDIGRSAPKPRKDLSYGAQIINHVGYFYDRLFEIKDPYPESVPPEDISVLLSEYLAGYKHSDDRSVWFERIRSIASANGYAAKPGEYKKNPGQYKGHVGDVSAVIRVALTGRVNSPDLWEIQRTMGEKKVRERISAAVRANSK
ncbi:MAG: glutamate--tRNA ligase [Clostridiales Family XIII bacterium]|jgi:glutamyl-tRNA synthetase|nr:glutamate--tRNA ligase [Clostridiales Family XIII bacterium]